MLMVTPTSRLLLFHLYATSCFLLSYHVVQGAAASPFSFSFHFSNTSTYRSDDLRFEGDAVQHAELVDLTCIPTVQPYYKNRTGRMSYKYPVPFHDTTTGEVASFTTRFTFAVKFYDGGGNKGGGMAFFLSSFASMLPPNYGGGNLGLPNGDRMGTNRFVAVEFDTYRDIFDPCDTNDHIAIDINSTWDSFNATCLPSSSLEGTMTAVITFNNTTNMLHTSLHFDDNPSRRSYEVSMHLPDPIKSLLPSEVAVGFSAATATSFELYQILSWSFHSTLAIHTGMYAPKAQPEPALVVTRKAQIGAQEAQQYQTKTSDGQQFAKELSASRRNLARMYAPEAQPESALVVTRKDQIGAPEAQQYQTNISDRQQFAKELSASRRNLAIVLTAGIVLIALCVGILFIRAAYALLTRVRESLLFDDLPQYEYRDLSRATDGFSQKNALGEGKFGIVYKGRLTKDNGNEEFAVKKIKQTENEVKDFFQEVTTVSATRHHNLVRLKGWCCSRSIWSSIDFMSWFKQRVKLFLVYELVPNGTLGHHLHHSKEILPWQKRYQIVKGIGSGLRYLHHECREPILHRDIKPDNILLDCDFNPKIADFGISRIASQNNTKVLTTAIGTDGYMDPQCRKHGQVEFGRKSDVYSFGIVLLEIACTDKSRELVSELYRHNAAGSELMKVVADGKLRGVFNGTEMERVIVLGLKCSHPDEKQRPYMDDAMKFLEDGTELPAIAEIEGQQGATFLGTISTDEELRS